MPNITQKMLTTQLRELEEKEIILDGEFIKSNYVNIYLRDMFKNTLQEILLELGYKKDNS